MFVPRPCSTPSCPHTALTGRDACADHCRDLDGFVGEIVQILRTKRQLSDFDISGITIGGLEVEGIRMSGCNLARVKFHGVSFRKAVIHLIFMDNAQVLECDFSSGAIHNSVFAGCTITDSHFLDSDLLQCNFLGARIKGTVFDHSNLNASRFTRAAFSGVGMKDCNLIRVHFDAKVQGVDFKSSNSNEAVFGEADR